MRLALLVPARFAADWPWSLICVREEDPAGASLAGAPKAIGARVVTAEAAREDYGVRILPPAGNSARRCPILPAPGSQQQQNAESRLVTDPARALSVDRRAHAS